MRRVLKILMIGAVTALVWTPLPAHAEGYVSPFIGVNFNNPSGNGRANYGINAGYMGAGGVIGGEFEFGYSPSFFGNQGTYGSNNVLDVMGNLIVGIPAGGTFGAGVRPYATIGFGLLRSQLNAGPFGAEQITNNDPGINVGAGVMGFLSDHVGLRGDVRYFRDVHNSSPANGFGIDFGGFHFWRASFGVVLR